MAARQQPAIQAAMANQQDALAIRSLYQAGAGDVTGAEAIAGEGRRRTFQQHQNEIAPFEGLAVGEIGKGACDSRNAQRIDHKKEKARPFGSGFYYKPGNFLLSHTLARAVPSGLRSLTAVFGKGTGGSSSLWSPRNW